MRYVEILREDITQTEAFKKWFEGSKIVDARGRPLRLYHGTSHNHITSFEVGFNSQGNKDFEGNHKVISFTVNPEFADNYAGTTHDTMWNRRPTVYPVYIRALNPGDFRNPEHCNMLIDYLKEQMLAWIEGVKITHAHVWTPEVIEQHLKKEFAHMEKLVNHGAWQKWERPGIWKEFGWDGAWMREDIHHPNKDVLNFAIADGRQAKAAYGTAAVHDLASGRLSKTSGPVIVIGTKYNQYQLGDGYHRVLEAILQGQTKIRAKKIKDGSSKFAITPNGQEWIFHPNSPTFGLEILFKSADIEKLIGQVQTNS